MNHEVASNESVMRPITARARRRSWMELPLRVWFVLLMLVGFATLLYTVTGVSEIVRERNLIEHGLPLTATVKEVWRNSVTARNVRRTDTLVELLLEYTLPGSEKKIVSKAMMTPFPVPTDGSPSPMIGVEQNIDIRVDPDEPTRWTNRTGLPAFGPRLAILLGLIPLLLLLAGIILLKRRSVLRLWRTGLPAEAVVIDAKQSALAPQSRVVRFTIEGSTDRRIRSALRPAHAGIPGNGDRLPILVLPSGRGSVIFTDLYDS